MIKTYNRYDMPYKLTLLHNETKLKLVYYKSITEFLSYDDTKFTSTSQDSKTKKPSSVRQQSKMQILWE